MTKIVLSSILILAACPAAVADPTLVPLGVTPLGISIELDGVVVTGTSSAEIGSVRAEIDQNHFEFTTSGLAGLPMRLTASFEYVVPDLGDSSTQVVARRSQTRPYRWATSRNCYEAASPFAKCLVYADRYSVGLVAVGSQLLAESAAVPFDTQVLDSVDTIFATGAVGDTIRWDLTFEVPVPGAFGAPGTACMSQGLTDLVSISDCLQTGDTIRLEIFVVGCSGEDCAQPSGDHTHTYLTGQGEGHNNAEAETGPAEPLP